MVGTAAGWSLHPQMHLCEGAGTVPTSEPPGPRLGQERPSGNPSRSCGHLMSKAFYEKI